MTAPKEPQNRLAAETSPYLRQHANNPVDWFPWGAEALDVARAEDRPILLSVGYSACHWCHVMAHESFEDTATAELMNELFINIKVDREERPDIDRIYQLAHQLLTQRSGGWPLTIFLTPETHTPFFAGTYFPVESRSAMPGFKDVLSRVASFYRSHLDDIRDQGEKIIQAMQAIEPRGIGSGTLLNDGPILAAREQLEQNFDTKDGGFGKAPKFPHPTNLERLFRHYAWSARTGKPDGQALAMAMFTLAKMGNGGLFDQLAGGYYRYSTDDTWTIPHFEKMLYDNGPLIGLNLDAWQLSGHDDFRRWAEETATWLVNEMEHERGGYFSALDADSEGEEGKFYLWTAEEVREVLDEHEYEPFSVRFGLDQDPSFEGEAWHLYVRAKLDELGVPLDEAEREIRSSRVKLAEYRHTHRILPARDEKILTAWNALTTKAMARAGALTHRPEFIRSAQRALDFILQESWRDGRLLAAHTDGQSRLMAYLDDHAYLLDALLTSASASWRAGDISWAVEIAELLLDKFRDEETGGFYFTADDHETLIHRPRPLMDDATPSGNGIAAQALARLGHLLGEVRYIEAAEAAIRAAWVGMERIPHAHCAMINALEEWLEPVQTIVIRGEAQAMADWHVRAARHYAPARQVFAIPSEESQLPGLLALRKAPEQGVLAYVCQGHRCDAPETDYASFEKVLAAGERVPKPRQ